MNKFVSNYLLRKYNVISFDIFDTLIERKVSKPSDIFYLTGKKILGEESAETFRDVRIKAEEKARSLKISNEVNLDEIYDNIKIYSKSQLELLKEKEIETEISNCIPRKGMFLFYNKCLKLNKKLLFISDMYLSSQVIKEILKNCGYLEITNLFISNEFGHSKKDGSLFDIALKKTNVKRKECIHIGDSYKADFLGARKEGLSALLVLRKNLIRNKVKTFF